jgi:hypothetical protein
VSRLELQGAKIPQGAKINIEFRCQGAKINIDFYLWCQGAKIPRCQVSRLELNFVYPVSRCQDPKVPRCQGVKV